MTCQHWLGNDILLHGTRLAKLQNGVVVGNGSATLKLSFNSTGILVGSWMIWIQYFLCSIIFWCILGILCRLERSIFYISSLRVRSHFGMWRGAKTSVAQYTNFECSLLKPPHRLQACTNNLSNMESITCKTTNLWPKLQLSWRITLLAPLVLIMMGTPTQP